MGETAGRAYAVKLEAFEGPLDLLLHLIRANEVDLSDIPIAQISAQYLDYLELWRSLDIDVAADYLLMAATLAHLKSRMLLPPDPDELAEPDAHDPRAELAQRLAEYARFQEVARELGARPLLGRDVFSGAVDPASIPEREATQPVSVVALLEALRGVLARVPPEPAPHAIGRERFTLRDRIRYVMDRLERSAEREVRLAALLEDGVPSRERIVLTFLAILELARLQVLRIFQNEDEGGAPSGPIRVHLTPEPGVDRIEAPGPICVAAPLPSPESA